MNKTFLVMSHEITSTLRRKMFIAFAFGLPLVIAVISLVLIFTRSDGDPEDGDASPGGTVQSQGYVDPGGVISEMPPEFPPDFLVPFADEAAAEEALLAETIRGYYVIPADYGESGELTVVTEDLNPLNGGYNTDAMEWVLFYNLFEGPPEQAARLWMPLQVSEQRLTPSETKGEGSWIAKLIPNIMALLLYMIIILSASVLVQSVTDEKKNRIMEVMLSSISSQQMITGKILGVGVLGMIMMFSWLGVLVLVVSFGGEALGIPLDFELPAGLIVWSIIYGVLGFGMYGAQMAGLGALVPELKDSRGASFIVLLPLIVVYVFLVVLVDSPNGALALFFSFFPLTAPVGMITRITATSVPLWQPILSGVLQLLTVVFIIRLTGRLFRAQVLLSGQPFSVRRYYGLMFSRS